MNNSLIYRNTKQLNKILGLILGMERSSPQRGRHIPSLL